jgi:hypothetical protein
LAIIDLGISGYGLGFGWVGDKKVLAVRSKQVEARKLRPRFTFFAF